MHPCEFMKLRRENKKRKKDEWKNMKARLWLWDKKRLYPGLVCYNGCVQRVSLQGMKGEKNKREQNKWGKTWQTTARQAQLESLLRQQRSERCSMAVLLGSGTQMNKVMVTSVKVCWTFSWSSQLNLSGLSVSHKHTLTDLNTQDLDLVFQLKAAQSQSWPWEL